MHRSWTYILRWIPVLLWMGLIFYLSAQPAGPSSELSSTVMDWMLQFVEGRLMVDESVFHVLIRKAAHMGAYFVLAVLTMIALRTPRIVSVWRQAGVSLIICVLYATSDEVHQLFVPGRSGEVRDVMIDTVGAVLGIGVYMICRVSFQRLQRH